MPFEIEEWDFMVSVFDEAKFERVIKKIDACIDITDTNPNFDDLRKLMYQFYSLWKSKSKKIIDTIGQDRTNTLLSYFSNYKYHLWDFEDFDFYLKLPDEITIYRGGRGQFDDVKKGYSWSLYLSIANEFARNHSDGIVISGSVQKESLLYATPMEFEVLPISVNVITNIQIVSDPESVVQEPIKFKEVLY